jgi:2,4-dienoyl-CoA reductase (NADPH2)
VARSHGAQIWMQLNHPGRQMPAALGQATVAPSAVALDMGRFSSQFAAPKEMTEAEILEVKRRFVEAAVLAEACRFDGAQIHAAHGYLISQFLSPLTNKRTDRWGGSIENRARLLLDVVREVRASVGRTFSVSVKLNSADFQRGGFSADDAKAVVSMLNPLGVDLLELSGGSYEAPAMQGQARDGRTLAREAYFLEFAQDIASVAAMPIMVTGGIRRLPVAEQVLDGGIDMVGIGTALALNPNLPREWKAGEASAPMLRPITWTNKVLASIAHMSMVKHQMRRLSRGRGPNPAVTPLCAFVEQQLDTTLKTRRYRRWMGRQAVLNTGLKRR